MRIGFEQACDVREILLALAPSARGVLRGPNLSLKHIFNGRNRHLHTQDVAWSGAFNERSISRVQLDLNAEVRSQSGNIHAVGKPFDTVRGP